MFLSPPRRFLVSFFLSFYLFLPRLKHPRPCRPLYASDRASTAIGWKGLPLGEKGLTRWGKSGLTSQVSPSGPEPSRFSLHQMSQGRVAGCSQELATGQRFAGRGYPGCDSVAISDWDMNEASRWTQRFRICFS